MNKINELANKFATNENCRIKLCDIRERDIKEIILNSYPFPSAHEEYKITQMKDGFKITKRTYSGGHYFIPNDYDFTISDDQLFHMIGKMQKATDFLSWNEENDTSHRGFYNWNIMLILTNGECQKASGNEETWPKFAILLKILKSTLRWIL